MTGTVNIRGLGAVTANGGTLPAVFEALCAGRSAVGRLRAFDQSRFRVRHAYEIDDRDGSDVPLRATTWLVRAVAEAARDAGLEDLRDVPILVGTGLRELRSAELRHRDARSGVVPSDAVTTGVDDLHFGSALRDAFGACRTYTISNACSASLYACALGEDMLRTGEARTVIVAGVDSITESMFGLLDRVHPQPPESVRPFDVERRGVLMGEGAAAVVLSVDQPGKAVLRSVGLSCDAFHVTAPDQEGIVRAIQDAHARASVEPGDIDVILAHGTGTLLNDEVEAAALVKVFAGGGAGPLLTAIKSMTGHTSGGSGLLGLAVAAESLRTGRIPPTVGLLGPVCDLGDMRMVRDRQVRAPLRIAQVDAFGFGGVNAVAVVAKAA